MAEVRLRPAAVGDLSDIWAYTCEKWDVEQAEVYLNALGAEFERLSHHPKLGPACDSIRSGYRKRLIGRHLIFYRVTASGVEVVRVLHASMDVDDELPKA